MNRPNPKGVIPLLNLADKFDRVSISILEGVDDSTFFIEQGDHGEHAHADDFV